MGSAQSDNSAQAVANVATFVSQSTTANSNQVTQTSKKEIFKDCVVELSGDLDITNAAKIAIKNQQISVAKEDVNVVNNIQQQVLQEAISKVGVLGVGAASANNSTSIMANSTTKIMNDMTTISNQYSTDNMEFVCDRSKITAKNLNINFSSDADFLSSQILNQQQTASVVNDISQTIKQKAEATVEGIGGLLIMILLCIAVIIYSVGKTLDSGSVKIVVAVVTSFIFAGVMGGMYVRQTPPLFGKTSECINGSNLGIGDDQSVQCINQSEQTINFPSAPIRYNYGLTKADSTKDYGNLLQIAIASSNSTLSAGSSGANGGYRIDTLLNLKSALQGFDALADKYKISKVPNPLTYIPFKDSTFAYYQIPLEYQENDSSSDTSGKCTPKTITLSQGASGSITNCDTIIDPVNQGLTGTSDPSLGVAQLNEDEWRSYLAGANPISEEDTSKNRALFARFVLASIIKNIDLHFYVDDDELVTFTDENGQAQTMMAKEDAGKHTYRFIPLSPDAQDVGFRKSISQGGKIIGQVGVWNTREYQFQNFMRKIGIWIILAIVVICFGYMIYTSIKNKGSSIQGSSIQAPSVQGKK